MSRARCLLSVTCLSVVVLLACSLLSFAPKAHAETGYQAAPTATTQVANIASGKCGTCTWVIDANGLLTIKPTNGKSGRLGESRGIVYDKDGWTDWAKSFFPWQKYHTRISKIKIASGIKAGKDASGLFAGETWFGDGWGFSYSSKDVTHIDFSDTERLDLAFAATKRLDSGVLKLNTTRKLKSVQNMFTISSGSSIALRMDTSNVTDMGGMFAFSKWEHVDLSTLYMRKADVTAFWGSDITWISSLKSLKVGKNSVFPKYMPLLNGTKFKPGKWWSFKNQKWYTPAQVQSKRSGIADTYYSTEVRDLAKGKLSLSKSNCTYDGKAKTPGVTMKSGSKMLKKDTDFTVAYKNNRNAGKATVTVKGKGSYRGTLSKTFKIAKAANPMKVIGKQTAVKYKKKAQTVKASKAYTFKKKAIGKVTYSRVSKGSSKWLPKVNAKTGAITVKKGTPRGKVQSVKVKVAAKGNDNYKSASKTVTVKVRVK